MSGRTPNQKTWGLVAPVVVLVAFNALTVMTVWELKRPGGGERRGVLGIDTTRGDRLFITLLGSAFIHLAWLGFVGSPVWAALGISVVYGIAVFRWV